MYKKILARYFDEQEVYLIDSAVRLIQSKEEVNVNMAYITLQSLELLDGYWMRWANIIKI